MSSEQHILACIDGSAVTESVCGYAAWYARQLQLPVGLLHVIDVPASKRRNLSGVIGVDSRQILLEELSQLDEQRAQILNGYSNALIEDAKSYIRPYGDVTIHAYRRHGKLLPSIQHFAKDNRAIVMGRRGEDHKDDRLNIGSQIETVARASNAPLLICSEPFKEPTSYLLAFDASKTATKAIDRITSSPLLRHLQGHIVMIGNHDETATQRLKSAVDQLRSSGFMVEAHHLPQSDIVNGLLTFQIDHHVDIIIIGAYGHSKWRQLFLGSTTTQIIASTLSPVILVR